MITRNDISDIGIVDKIIKRPDVYPYISDDSSPDVAQYSAEQMLSNNQIFFLNEKNKMLFIFMPFTHGVYMLHTCIPTESRGAGAFNAAFSAADWMFKQTNAKKIITLIPDNNRRAKVFAYYCGMKKVGFLSGAWTKNGQSCGLNILEKDK